MIMIFGRGIVFTAEDFGNQGAKEGWLTTDFYQIDDALDPEMVATNAIVASDY